MLIQFAVRAHSRVVGITRQGVGDGVVRNRGADAAVGGDRLTKRARWTYRRRHFRAFAAGPFTAVPAPRPVSDLGSH
jgi:hypothetical protein